MDINRTIFKLNGDFNPKSAIISKNTDKKGKKF